MQQQWLQMATGRAVILARFSRWLVPAALLVVVPLFFIDLDRWIGDVPSELHAFAHVGFFGVLAWILMALPGLRARPFARRAAWVLLVVLLVSILVELVQTFFGRSAGLRDIWQNLVGAMAAVALHAPAGAGRRRLVGIAIALLALELAGPGIGLWDRAVARTQFPVLGDFETRFEHWRWSSGVPERTVSVLPNTHFRRPGADRMMLPSPMRWGRHHGMAAAQSERVAAAGGGLAA
jgi:hypothetical protein